MTPAERTAAVLAEAMLAEGAGPESSIHSWRCEYPNAYGPCSCVTQVAQELRNALADAGLLVTPDHDAEVAARAWDEGFTRGFYDPLAGSSAADASESSATNPYDRVENGGDS